MRRGPVQVNTNATYSPVDRHTPLHSFPFTASVALSGRVIAFLLTLLPSHCFPPRRLPNVLSSIIYLLSPRAPSYRIAMSNEAHKADQIAYRYYTKLVSVVHSARATTEPNPQAKVDKWVRHCLILACLRLTKSSSVQPRDS